jgi:hypothetical protein
MALFTDGNIANLNDLRAYESSILDLAATEGVDLGAKLTLAQRELGLELTSFLLRRGHLGGSRRELSSVVVTDPMLHAHTMLTLSLIYRDAYNSQLNDRYEGKWRQYSELARVAVRQLLDIGVGISYTPLPKPEQPSAGIVLGGFTPGTTYTVRCALTGSGRGTSALSDSLLVELTPGQRLEVTTGVLPKVAAGWLIYVADGAGPLLRQTETPLGSLDVWTCPVEGIRTDLGGPDIQTPDAYVTQRQELLRG